MRRWKLKSLRVSDVFDLKFEETSQRQYAMKAMEISKDTAIGKWSTVALTGWFFKCYEDRFKRPWKGSSNECADVHSQLEDLVEREGTEVVYRSINVIFSDRMRWVTSNHLGALMRDSFFRDYIVPAINTPVAVQGEGSEYQGAKLAKGFEKLAF